MHPIESGFILFFEFKHKNGCMLILSSVENLQQLTELLRAIPQNMALGHLMALVAIAREPGLSVNELSARIDAPQQSASRYLAVLLGRYQSIDAAEAPPVLVDQRVSESDPRKRALFLTEQGNELIDRLLRAGWGFRGPEHES